MTDPWNIKIDDSRQPDSLPTFIIFCEDKVSEPIYFKFFETSKIKINPIEDQKSNIENVIKAICHCKEDGLMENRDGLLYLNKLDTHVWCVFDRDTENNCTNIEHNNIKFDHSIQTAIQSGINVAWSNDAFELWVLLHFEDVDPADEKYYLRKSYYERLTEIFMNLPDPVEDLVSAKNHSSFNYKQDLKHANNFRNIVRSAIVAKTKIAIDRAEKLEKFHNIVNKPNHLKAPCTLVHHLVAELIRVGEKNI